MIRPKVTDSVRTTCGPVRTPGPWLVRTFEDPLQLVWVVGASAPPPRVCNTHPSAGLQSAAQSQQSPTVFTCTKSVAITPATSLSTCIYNKDVKTTNVGL